MIRALSCQQTPLCCVQPESEVRIRKVCRRHDPIHGWQKEDAAGQPQAACLSGQIVTNNMIGPLAFDRCRTACSGRVRVSTGSGGACMCLAYIVIQRGTSQATNVL
jgi:hypothetical protein